MDFELYNQQVDRLATAQNVADLPVPAGCQPLAFFEKMGLSYEQLCQYLPYYQVQGDTPEEEVFFLNPGLKEGMEGLLIEGAVYQVSKNFTPVLRTERWEEAFALIPANYLPEYDMEALAMEDGGNYAERTMLDFDAETQEHVAIDITLTISGKEHALCLEYFYLYTTED